jgi:nucleoside-diphosphate-sugar epimerase
MQAGQSGIYNIVDDEPAPLNTWLPHYASLLKAPNPWRLPTFIGRLAAGRFGVYFMTEQRGASNRKAKQQLHWQPAYTSWRTGFQASLTAQGQPEPMQPHLAGA